MNSEYLFRTFGLLAAVSMGLTQNSFAQGQARFGGTYPANVANRGNPAEYEEGIPADWMQLFSKLPNYRAINAAIYKDSGLKPYDAERYRWPYGPLFYRGRLSKDKYCPTGVKILVVGQEGAEDEALAHRAFVGGTGQRVQGFLRSVGITRCYTFMNTFVYSIKDQYNMGPFEGRDFKMAQDSPISQHRNMMFSKLIDENPVRIILAVGGGAQDSVETFAKFRASLGRPLEKSGIKVVHLRHPGQLGQIVKTLEKQGVPNQQAIGRALAQLGPDAQRAQKSILAHEPFARNTDVAPFTAYFYQNAPIPYADFPFGMQKSLGQNSTVGQRTKGNFVLILNSGTKFSKNVEDRQFFWSKNRSDRVETSGYVRTQGNLAWEGERANPMKFNLGPGSRWAQFLASAPPLPGNVDEFEPVFYRGRLGMPKSAGILVLADQGSEDDLYSGRALVGDDGQKLQALLALSGVQNQYVILRTLWKSMYGNSASDIARMMADPKVQAFRAAMIRAVLAEQPIRAVIVMGKYAELAWKQFAQTSRAGEVDARNVYVISSPSQGASVGQIVKEWNQTVIALRKVVGLGDAGGRLFDERTFAQSRLQVPREDLPPFIPLWYGTSGDLGTRIQDRQFQTGRFALFAPRWLYAERY